MKASSPGFPLGVISSSPSFMTWQVAPWLDTRTDRFSPYWGPGTLPALPRGGAQCWLAGGRSSYWHALERADNLAVTAVDEHRERQSPPVPQRGRETCGVGGWRRSRAVPRQPGSASPEAAGGAAEAPGASGKSGRPSARSCPRVLRPSQSRRLAGGVGSPFQPPTRRARR